MSFFGLGKKKKKTGTKLPVGMELPPLPPIDNFEAIGRYNKKKPEFPVYKEETKDLGPPNLDLELPKREKVIKKEPIAPIKSIPIKTHIHNVEDKSIFVEIDDYKAAIAKIESIREKIRDAEKILDDITRLKHEEDNQLESWKRDIGEVKRKLIEIDQRLFES